MNTSITILFSSLSDLNLFFLPLPRDTLGFEANKISIDPTTVSTDSTSTTNELSSLEEDSSTSVSSTHNNQSIPAAHRTDQEKKPLCKAFQSLLSRLLVVAAVTAGTNSVISTGLVRYMGSWFTTDSRIIECMSSQSMWMGLSLFLHSFILVLEGAIIAGRDVAFLAWTYLATLALLMLRLNYCTAFHGVWQTLFIFQTIRLAQFASRILGRLRAQNEDTSARN